MPTRCQPKGRPPVHPISGEPHGVIFRIREPRFSAANLGSGPPSVRRACATRVGRTRMLLRATDARGMAMGHGGTYFYFRPWYDRSPYFEATQRAGCKSYELYNNMYLPGFYSSFEEEYWHLVNHVALWDVAVERCVEITGPDAHRFTNMLTCRDLDEGAVGQAKYAPIMADDVGIVNDPVLLRLGENHYWLALADSDGLLYTRGVATFANMDVVIDIADSWPVQIQGPKSRDVMRALFGERIDDIRYYWA